MWDILGGALLIVMGVVGGNSVFRGDFTWLSIPFDGLGLFFVAWGIVRMNRSRQER